MVAVNARSFGLEQKDALEVNVIDFPFLNFRSPPNTRRHGWLPPTVDTA